MNDLVVIGAGPAGLAAAVGEGTVGEGAVGVQLLHCVRAEEPAKTEPLGGMQREVGCMRATRQMSDAKGPIDAQRTDM